MVDFLMGLVIFYMGFMMVFVWSVFDMLVEIYEVVSSFFGGFVM